MLNPIPSATIATTRKPGRIHFKTWFKKRKGYLFDNYFHALAYSLKLKAEHGQKAKSEERTGMAGAP